MVATAVLPARETTRAMYTAVYAPIFNDYSDPARLVSLAVAAENAGYDGFFIWDHLAIVPDGSLALLDAMTVLGAIAQATQRLKFGPMITPLARRRPWKLAKELVTLDQLSQGRVIFGAGLGEPAEVEFSRFGEDPTARAARLDEGLFVLQQLLSGAPLDHRGTHYQVRDMCLQPPPFNRREIPIWIAAALPATAGLRRAARWHGVFPLRLPETLAHGDVTTVPWPEWWLSPDELRAALARVNEFGANKTCDAVACGRISARAGRDARAEMRRYAAAGATWWFEWIDDAPGSFDTTLAAIARGLPSF